MKPCFPDDRIEQVLAGDPLTPEERAYLLEDTPTFEECDKETAAALPAMDDKTPVGARPASAEGRKTMSKLKVFGWQSFRAGRQTREIVAAPSKAAVARLAGANRPDQLFNLCETGNEQETETALTEPGVVFWREIGARTRPFSRSGE